MLRTQLAVSSDRPKSPGLTGFCVLLSLVPFLLLASCHDSKVGASPKSLASQDGDTTLNAVDSHGQPSADLFAFDKTSFAQFHAAFLDKIWSDNLPANSLEAQNSAGMTVTHKEFANQGNSYFVRYGFETRIVCRNQHTEIEYWERPGKSIIWAFTTNDPSVRIMNYSLLGKTPQQVFRLIGLPSATLDDTAVYANKDFEFRIVFTHGLAASIVFTRYV